MNNFFLIVLDGVGVGELPDAENYKGCGSNTLANIAGKIGGLSLPNLQKMGLGNIIKIKGIPESKMPLASFGKMREASKGKDSTTGHWELAGLFVDTEFSYFPNGFPEQIISDFTSKTGVKGVLGNYAASGTEIIKKLGDEHVRTGYPIIYTSADSVFQIAAHEEFFGLNKLYEICEITRNEILLPPVIVGRVIARPFVGESGNYIRTVNRIDYSLDPPAETILDILQKNNIHTLSIGKVSDLFNNRGIDIIEHTKSNKEGCEKLNYAARSLEDTFIFANLVDFDVYYGHRNDPVGFAKALTEFDQFLPDFLENLDESDRLIICADHGNDPTTASTDHSREYVPLLYYRKSKPGNDLGIRNTFSDAAKTAAEFFDINNNLNGTSFLNE